MNLLLRIHNTEDIALNAFLALVSADGTRYVGWYASARETAWIVVEGEPTAHHALLAEAFAVHLFNGAAEWRWERSSTSGSASCVTESGLGRGPPGWTTVDPAATAAFDESLPLWGTPLGAADVGPGWCRLGHARSGPFDVPHSPPGEGSSLVLVRRTYLGANEELDGNAEILAVRNVAVRAAVPLSGWRQRTIIDGGERGV